MNIDMQWKPPDKMVRNFKVTETKQQQQQNSKTWGCNLEDKGL